ncbi:MAG TPA: GDSL-type esterase/lipase family protein [Candidatus Bilamarchaeum sp.]|nr:GDSL-type esterase/lipase family protein [Candidatus Bilamarchaeum sp.]
MAEVRLQGNTIVIVAGGTSRSSGVSVRAGMSEADIRGAINAALANVRNFFDGAGIDVGRTDVNGAARTIYRQLNPEAQPAQPQRREERRDEPARREPPPRRERREERRDEGRGRDVRAATPRRTFPTQATEVIPWVTLQLREAARDERRSVAAASTLHTNREFLNQYLSSDLQRGTLRTANQRDTTIAVFNSLYQIPAFRLYLSSVAATQAEYFPQFVQLQSFLTEPGRPEMLSEQANAEIIRAADMYVRYFLLGFVAPNDANARYRAEVAQLPNAERVRARIHEARTFTATSGRQPDERTRFAFISMNLGGAMDADTVTASSLYIRRWTQEHPERGRGREDGQIDQWAAPQVVPLEGTAAPVQPQAPTVTVPRVAVVGDSLIAGNRIGTTLQRLLREGAGATPDAAVDSYGVSGEDLSHVRSRFNRDVLGHQPPYNVVVIHAGVNGIGSGTVEQLEGRYAQFIRAARDGNMRVVILGLLPWAGASTSTSDLQRRTTQFNQWLREQATADGNVVFIDTAALIGEGNPPRLRAQYERETDPDHLHPSDAGRDVIARQVAQAAFGRTIGAAESRSALQDFADRNWRNLATELYQNVQGGRPAGIVTIMRNLPQGYSSIEDALRALNRTDIRDAFDRVFNDYLHSNTAFLQFCRDNSDFTGVARESTRLSGTTSEADRRVVMRAMARFINQEAQRSGDVYTRLRQDLALLYRQGFSMGRDDYDPTGVTDPRLLAAMAVYSWRMANPNANVGDWGQSINIRPQAPPQQRQEPPPTQVEPQPGSRRRVIQPG